VFSEEFGMCAVTAKHILALVEADLPAAGEMDVAVSALCFRKGRYPIDENK
jgi:hypothetical protein